MIPGASDWIIYIGTTPIVMPARPWRSGGSIAGGGRMKEGFVPARPRCRQTGQPAHRVVLGTPGPYAGTVDSAWVVDGSRSWRCVTRPPVPGDPPLRRAGSYAQNSAPCPADEQRRSVEKTIGRPSFPGCIQENQNPMSVSKVRTDPYAYTARTRPGSTSVRQGFRCTPPASS